MDSSPSPKRRRLSPPDRSPERPSFASPTRASLARHNPDVLTRRASSRPSRSENSGAVSINDYGDEEENSAAAESQLILESETNNALVASDAQETPTAAAANDGQGSDDELESATAPNRRISQQSRVVSSNSPRPFVRPLPRRALDDEDDVLGEMFSRRPRRSMHKGIFAQDSLHETELELPPTPSRPDPIVSTPPSGIHNTPSRRPRRSRLLAQQLQSSSPLKHAHSALKAGRRDEENVEPVPMELSGSSPQPQTDAHDVVDVVGPDPLRGIVAPDPFARQKTQRQALMDEVSQLEADLKALQRLNATTADAGTSPESHILETLHKHLVPTEAAVEDSSLHSFWQQAVLDPTNLLPFSGPSSQPFTQILQPKAPKEKPPPISHHPVSMTAKDELPYLQLFSPLSFTSTTKIDEQTKIQSRIINIRSVTMPGLFTARIEMSVDLESLAVTDLKVSRLDTAAKAELAPFIASVTRQDKAHMGSINNISLLTWAMSEWCRVASERAKFWHTLDQELGSKQALLRQVTQLRQGKPQRVPLIIGNGDGDLESETVMNEGECMRWLGNTSMELTIPMTTTSTTKSQMTGLLVQWTIEFDWTGEARSKIGCKVRVPSKWHNADERRGLVQVPQMFDKILQRDENPLAAVRTVVALLAGDVTA